jgi:hypothetical protein
MKRVSIALRFLAIARHSHTWQLEENHHQHTSLFNLTILKLSDASHVFDE